MKWQSEILELRDPAIKRMRFVISTSTAFPRIEIPFDQPIPKDTGFCMRPQQRDSIVVVGFDQNGKQKQIKCGLFSQDLLKRIQTILENKIE